MTARPPEGATFEISRIGRPRSRAPVAALLWTAALVGIVAVGIFGRSPARPAVGPVTLTDARLTVLGKVLVHAARVEISLEARGNRVIDSVAVDVSDPDGGIRRAQQAAFEVQFEVPYPRPNGTMWVVVTAFDAFGMPLGGERRSFLVGPISQAAVNVDWHNPQSR